MIYLLEYDRQRGLVVQMQAFEAADVLLADDQRLALEVSNLASSIGHEVVLLEARDTESLKRTHRRYFAGIQELIRLAA